MARQQQPAGSRPCPWGGHGRHLAYAKCCRPYVEGGIPAPDAERLMRSRYTAYVLGNTDYLLASWHASTRPARDTFELGDAGAKWLGLTVHSHAQQDETHAQVYFTARYREAGRGHRMTERSNFVLEDGRWFYVDGVVEAS
jgi:SEC-C motif-containing protein